MQKQILLLQNLGIPHEEFRKKTENLNYTFISDEKNATPTAVEIIITITTAVDKKVLEKYPNLKMVAVAFTGFDVVDMEACQEKNIAVYNVPTYATNSVAELAVGLAIALLREIPHADQIVKNQKWNINPGFDLANKTIGIAGTGTIGIATAKLFKAFGCKLIGWSKTVRKEFEKIGGNYVTKKELFAQADIVSIHLPLNDHTRASIGKEEFEAMKKSAFLINTARGPIVHEMELIKALKENKIAGAALDVFENEPIKPDNELLKLNNVILTPHIAYKTHEALQRRAEVTIQNIEDFLKGEKGNRVDLN